LDLEVEVRTIKRVSFVFAVGVIWMAVTMSQAGAIAFGSGNVEEGVNLIVGDNNTVPLAKMGRDGVGLRHDQAGRPGKVSDDHELSGKLRG
jgi:hypothetical protein